ncbi:MAG: hypothetical protein H0T91_01985 [Propionibacteriaceae bacterium]|nr:hypothetical protein [Propionibacteriaceae bacterium]
MTGQAAAAVILWALLTVLSVWVWLPAKARMGKPLRARTSVLISTLVVLVIGTAVVALLASLAPPTTGRWSWLAIAVAAAAALLTGGAVTSCILDLADASSRPVAHRVQRTVLRGGAWIGALERLGLVVSLLARWPEGIAIILAVKSLARYPELKLSQSTGAAERFIIGTFASLGWAAACAGVAVILT